MKINRPYITGHSKPDEVKILEVTGLSLTKYIEKYLKEQWNIYTFLYTDITGRFDNGIQVYEMQFTPFIREEKLQEAIEALDEAIISEMANDAETDAVQDNDDDALTDWEDYWNYQSKLSGSFAASHLEGSSIEKHAKYEDLFGLSDKFKTAFPHLTELLQQARITKIASSGSGNFYMLGWSFEYGHFGGLMPEPGYDCDMAILPEHALLLSNFGGFIDWFGDNIDSNYFSAADDYELAAGNVTSFGDPGRNFIQFTRESNGDFFCYDTDTAEVWKFCCSGYGRGIIREEYGDDIKLVKNNERSDSLLFKVENCTFTDWIERGAQAWLNCMEELPYV